MKKILIVDDDMYYLKTLEILFKDKYSVYATTSVVEALTLIKDIEFDLMIVDYHLNEMNGATFIDTVTKLFDNQNIVIISGIISDEEQVVLDCKAIEFISKEIPAESLRVKIELILNRVIDTIGSISRLECTNENITIYSKRRCLEKDGKEMKLSKTEFNVFYLFLTNKGKILSREFLYERAWKNNSKCSNLRVVDSLVLTIRKKYGIKSISSKRGEGYVWKI